MKQQRNRLSLADKLKTLPKKSGVYLFKNKDRQIIYIGKAKNLRNRVSTYFQSAKRQTLFWHKIVDLDWIVTLQESAALILEDNLIKLHKPKYNIQLKDNKTYPHIKVTVNEKYPRLFLTRRIADDKAHYYGPYSSVHDARATLQAIHKYFPLRTSKMNLDSGKTYRPCLNFQLKRCLAPCRGTVKVEEYRLIVRQVEKFLQGSYQELLRELKEKMFQKSQQQDYEMAARIRDQIKSVTETLKNKPQLTAAKLDCDLFAIARQAGFAGAQLLFIREGIVVGNDFLFLKQENVSSDQEIIRLLFSQTYLRSTKNPPPLIYVPEVTAETKMLEHYIAKERKLQIRVKKPNQREKKQFYDTATQNCLANLKSHIKADQTQQEVLNNVQKDLQLNNLPVRVESFDISNLSGTSNVASMVVFRDNVPVKQDYRRFKIKTVAGVDDFSSMAEVIKRRFERALKGSWSLPDLMIIDGGLGQLNAALAVIARVIPVDFLINLDVIALAKGRSAKKNQRLVKNYEADFDFEYILTPKSKNPIRLAKNSVSLHFLKRVRDEAHRFALAYHKTLRSKAMLDSDLDAISGIGPRKKKILLESLGRVDTIKQASKVQLQKISGINSKDAANIFEYFRKANAS